MNFSSLTNGLFGDYTKNSHVSITSDKVVSNGRTIKVPKGASVSTINGDVYINGKKHEFEDDFKIGTLIIEGDCGDIEVDGNLTIRGLGGNANVKGNINSGDIGGDVNCGGICNCGDIKGNVKASIVNRR